jgi:hypothetical protein
MRARLWIASLKASASSRRKEGLFLSAELRIRLKSPRRIQGVFGGAWIV